MSFYFKYARLYKNQKRKTKLHVCTSQCAILVSGLESVGKWMEGNVFGFHWIADSLWDSLFSWDTVNHLLDVTVFQGNVRADSLGGVHTVFSCHLVARLQR